MTDDGREWLKIVIAAAAVVVATIAIMWAIGQVLGDLQKTTARHDAEHAGFRDDIIELRETCKTGCRR